MSKNNLREILPPTTRNFEHRMGDLERRTDTIEKRLAHIEARLAYEAPLAASNTEYALFAALEALRDNKDRPPRILLAGWYGAQNLGDELMMQTVLERLPEELLTHTTVLLWNDPDYPLGKIDPRVKVLHYPPTTAGIQALAELFDVLIWGGGAIIDDKQYDLDPRNYSTGNLFIHLSKRMLAQNKQTYCIALSSNDSLSDDCYKAELASLVAGAHYFSVRDPYSKETLAKAGIDVSPVVIDNDIAFASEQLRDLSAQNAMHTSNVRPETIGLVLHCFAELEAFNYQLLCDTAALAQEHAVNAGATRILLIPFYNEDQSDTSYLKELAKRFIAEHPNTPAPVVAPYEEDLARSPLLDCDLLVSCRYHASLIAGCLRIPFVAICNDTHAHYPNKTRYLLEQLFPSDRADQAFLCVKEYTKEGLAQNFVLAQKRSIEKQTVRELTAATIANLERTLASIA